MGCVAEEPGKTGRLTKVPYKLDGGKAATDNPDTWATRAVAERAANRLRERSGPGAKVGIGMVLGERGKLASTPLAGLDLDSCFDEEGHTQPWA